MRRLSWPWERNIGNEGRRCAHAKRQKSRSLRKRGHWARIASVRTSGSLRRAGRPGRRVAEGWSAFHQSSIWTYNETKKESRSTMGHRLWEKVRCQHKVSAPSSSSAITHQPSKKFAPDIRQWHHAPLSSIGITPPEQASCARRLLIMRISSGLFLVALAILIAVGGLVLVQRLYSTDQRKQHNDVAGFIYAVLLGLMLIAVWQKWNAAEAVATDEANELAGIFWYAHALPQPEGRHIQKLVRSYDEVVIEQEWPLMAQGRSSPKAWAILDELRATILGLKPPKGDAKQMGYEQMRYEEILVQLHDLGNARRERLLAAEQGLPPILWVVLILGGVITVGFTYLFGLNNTLVHLLMVAALALIISISLFTVAALDYPFKGDIHIHPSAYENDLERFRVSKLSDL